MNKQIKKQFKKQLEDSLTNELKKQFMVLVDKKTDNLSVEALKKFNKIKLAGKSPEEVLEILDNMKDEK